MIERGEIWTLDDEKKYVVASIVEIEQKVYVYLVKKDDYNKYVIGEFDGEGINEIEDPELLETLLVRFNEDLKTNLPNILAEYL